MGKPEELPKEVKVIETWPDVDRTLLALRVARATIEMVSAKFDTAIQVAQEGKAKALKITHGRLERMEKVIEDWVTDHRSGFKPGAKSLVLVHGRVGFRKKPAKMRYLFGEEYTLERLQELKLVDCIKVAAPEIVKDQVKRLAADVLLQVGVAIDQAEGFYYELANDPPIVYPDVDDIDTDTDVDTDKKAEDKGTAPEGT